MTPEEQTNLLLSLGCKPGGEYEYDGEKLTEAVPAMITILDVIMLTPYGLPHYYVVLNEMPAFVFERQGENLVAEHDGFFERYRRETPTERWKAFGGRKFDLPLKDGTVEHACGQWWWSAPMISANPGPIISVGISTVELLRKCYVFTSGCIAKEKLDAWLATHEPTTDYDKYSNRK